MTGVLKFAAKALQVLYEDSAEVYRIQEQGNALDFQKIHSGIACHLSIDSKPVLQQGEAAATAQSEYTLFCPPDTDIREGDRVQVRHMGKTAWYDVGTAFSYDLNRLCRCTKRGVV